MIKNLIYGALGLGGAALAVTAMIAANESAPDTQPAVALGATGDSLGDTGTEVHYVTNTPDKSLCVYEGTVAKFPVVFYGTAEAQWKYEYYYPTHKIIIDTPANVTNDFRLSLDPQTCNDARAYGVTLYITNCTSGACTTNSFGYSKDSPVDFVAHTNKFVGGERYVLTLDFGKKKSETINYALGIGLAGVQVKFDESDSGYFTEGASNNWNLVGVNYTSEESYYGFLPTPKAKPIDPYKNATFAGWYTAPDASGVACGTKVETSSGVLSNEMLYAHWKYSSYDYYVDFDKGEATDAEGEMPVQKMTSDTPTALYRNCYYVEGRRFLGWRSWESGAYYDNGQVVTNLCSRSNATNHLYAIWSAKTNSHYYVVRKPNVVFTNAVVSTNAPVSVESIGTGSGSSPAFYLDITNMTNSASCRVSVDPVAGANRSKGLTLHIDQWSSTNAWSVGAADGWASNVCEATEFEHEPIFHDFTNGVYRFRVTGVASNEYYVVGIGEQGEQVNFEPFAGDVETYNWTTETPYGYLPSLADHKDFGKLLGWYYTNDGDTNDNNRVKTTDLVKYGTLGTNTVYALWSNPVYYVDFDANGGSGTKMALQAFYRNAAQALNRNQYYKNDYRFDGWTNAAGKAYADCEVVSNLCTVAGDTCKLYAVWQSTPGTNWYYVGGVMTNFQNISISQGSPTHFVGTGDSTQFFVSATATNKCRVAIDPVLGFARTNASLTVSCRQTATNDWETACSVTDLQEKEATCSFKRGWQYRFDVTLPGAGKDYQYDVTLGAEGARYIFDVCGGNFVGEKDTTKVKFYNWTVGTEIAYAPPVTTNKWVGGTNTWHYTPQYVTNEEFKVFNVTNVVVSGGEKLYAHWSQAVIVPLVFDWNLAETNIVFTNYYAQGANVYLYQDAYVRQPTYDNLGFLGWTTNAASTAGYGLTLEPLTTNYFMTVFYAQWTAEWKTSHTSDGAGLSIDGYFGTLDDTLEIPANVNTVSGIKWPANVVAIGDSAFTNATFTALSLPATLTRIGDSAFEGCSEFTTLAIPQTVTYVGVSAFEDCTSLKTVTFPTVEVSNEYATSGFLDGIFEGGTPSVELCECLFKGCTSLTSVELPLGVNCIPDECFSGCLSLTTFASMPYTVITIGSKAFYGCTHLTSVDHTEIVGEIGAYAYRKCARLKFLNFIGDNPESVESDILSGTPRNALVRYLENMCTTAKDYCGGSWPSLPSLWPEAGATNSSRTLTWLGGKYPRRKVIFNYNNNDVIWKSTQVPALYHSGRVFGLLAPTEDEMNNANGVTTSRNDDDDEEEEEEEEEEELSGFSGWYTQPMGGRKIGNYWVVPTASEDDSAPITVYAHWGDEDGEGEEAGSRSYGVYYGHDENTDDFESFPGFYTVETEDEDGDIVTDGDESFYYAASTFNGIVIDLNSENAVTGTVAFVFEDGTYPADGGMQAKFKATVTWNSGRKTTFSGVANAEGYLVSGSSAWSLGKEGEDHRTVVTKSGINGWLSNGEDEFRIYAARDRYSATDGSAWSIVQKDLQATRGTWHVVLANETPEPAEGYEGSVDFQGYSTMSITIANMGAATITGTLGDGTKVSASSTLIVGDGCACLPVNVRASGKGGLSFLLWFTWQSDGSFDVDDATIQGLTDWTTPTFTAKMSAVQPLTFIDEQRYSGEATFDADGEATATLKMEDTTWKVTDAGDNKVRVTYDAATGVFKGSFSAETSEGQTTTASVSGVFTDLITTEDDEVTEVYHGYGTAVIKGERSIPVEITTLDD